MESTIRDLIQRWGGFKSAMIIGSPGATLATYMRVDELILSLKSFFEDNGDVEE